MSGGVIAIVMERSGEAMKAEKGKAYKTHTFEPAELVLSA